VFAFPCAGEPFSQRFTTTLSYDGTTITGCWGIAEDGINYTTDFDVIYRRVDTKRCRHESPELDAH